MPSIAPDVRIQTLRSLLYEEEQESATNSQNALTIPAPGAGKTLLLWEVQARYSNQTGQTVTVQYTDRDGASQSFTIRTGASTAPARTPFRPPGPGTLLTEENSSITVTAPAASGETSTIRVLWAEVPEELLAQVLDY